MAPSDTDPAEGCPVDHNARAAWLEKAAQAGGSLRPPHPMPIPSLSSSLSPTPDDSSHIANIKSRPLALDREVSTIPRAPAPSKDGPSENSAMAAARPSNHEVESGMSTGGNWIYPSEKMFFEAMRRKKHSPEARDMAAIVPIHNAVNERAWQEIKAWESRFAWARAANARCNGPRLASFSGDSSKLSPKARLNGLVGYQAPFDRHDWVVERCGENDTVEYIIDFYQGRDNGQGKGLSFYLDVRPKLNTWEGCKMRLLSLLGW